MNRKLFALISIFLMLLSSCNKVSSPDINPEVLPTVTPPSLPEAGKATIVGQINNKTGDPMINTIVRMAVVVRGAEGRGGAYILDISRSPGTITDEYGYFTIQNVDAGEYVIVVGDIEITGVYEIISQPNGPARVWELAADQITDVGVITVSITPPTAVPTITPGPYPEPTAYPSP
jgi:hypothetical protein